LSNNSENGNAVVTEVTSVTLEESEQIEMKNMTASDTSNAPAIKLPNLGSLRGQREASNISKSANFSEDRPSHPTIPKEEGADDTSKNDKKRRPNREILQRRITMMFFLLIVIFIISYIPPLVLLIITYINKDFKFIKMSNEETLVWMYVRHVVLLNHVSNPFIYGYFDYKFRKKVILCFKRCIHAF
jgi:uncharacterized membrane protein